MLQAGLFCQGVYYLLPKVHIFTANNYHINCYTSLPFGTLTTHSTTSFMLVQEIDQHRKQNGMKNRLRNDKIEETLVITMQDIMIKTSCQMHVTEIQMLSHPSFFHLAPAM